MKSTGYKLNTHKRESGVYMLDMMIALAVGVILLCTGVPTFSSVVHKNRITSVTTLLYMSLNEARSEALKRRNPVRVCPSANGTSCRNDGDWSDGWLIFEDVNANSAPDSTEIIQLVSTFDENVDMQVSTSLAGFVQFQPTGAALGSGGNTGEFRLCHADSSAYSRVVSISATGRVNDESRTRTDCDAI